MKGTTNAQRNAIIDSTSAVDSLTLTKADGTTQKHTVSNIIPKDDAPTSGSSKFVTSGVIYTALNGKVSVVSGKGLSTNDYTTAEKTKVSNLPANANTTFATKTELTDALSSVYKYKGSVNTYGNLPSNATAGDVYNVVASYNGVPAGTNWAWNGSSWDALGGTVTGYVADTTTVNGKPLSSNVTLAAADVGAVPTSRTVNGKALSSDISLTASDVGALASGGTAAKATADASGNNIVNTYATKAELTNGLAGKQSSLTFDSAPTSGSSNPVTSGGVYSAINTKQDKMPIGQEGYVWTAGEDGSGSWKEITGSNSDSEIKELPNGDYIIPSDGEYTIVAIGGKGGDGGDGGNGGASGDLLINYFTRGGYGIHALFYGGKGGAGGKGGIGGYGQVSSTRVRLSKGDVLRISLGIGGSDGQKGADGAAGAYTTITTDMYGYGTTGSDGSTGENGTNGNATEVYLNDSLILTASGGSFGAGGYGGKKASNTYFQSTEYGPRGYGGNGGSGGNGGNGGSGGLGGNGGKVGNGGTGGAEATVYSVKINGTYATNAGSNGKNGTSSGDGGNTISPDSSEAVSAAGSIASTQWVNSANLFDVTFNGLAEFINLKNSKDGRVFILSKVSQFPL